MSHHIKRLEGLINYLQRLINKETIHKEILMSVATTDDFSIRIRPKAVDVDGVVVPATGLTLSVDKPDQASVTPDDANPGAYLVKRLPTTDPSASILNVVVSATDPATGTTSNLLVEFDPGKSASLVLDSELVPNAAPAAA